MTATALLLLALSATPTAAPTAAPAAAPAAASAEMTERQKTLYALGVSAAESFSVFELKQGEVAVVQRGLSDALLKKKLKVDMKVYRPKVNELAASGYAAKSAAMVARYGAQPGAVTTASGLVYIETRAGTGAQPGPTDAVKVHYDGKLADGTVFDSSRRRGEPSTLPIDKVIPCWREALQRMKVGAVAAIVCPADIAYGEAGRPPTIPPNSALLFAIELIGIEAPAK
jgi:FKBP-type peptidyl-prolyl cis-trans isomerase FkpA